MMNADKASDGSHAPVWLVEVNGITVGNISYADYLEIRKAVFSDVRIYVAQLFNLGKVVFLVVNRLIIFTTIVFCCLLIAFFIYCARDFH